MKHLHLPWDIFVWLGISWASASQANRVLEHQSSWVCCLGRCPVVCFPLEQTAPGPFPLGHDTHHGISSSVALSWAVVGVGIGIWAANAVFLMGNVFLHGLARHG